jgi:hypothetical protein
MKATGKKECAFYESWYKQVPKLQAFAPKYYGQEARDDIHYVIMEDLTAPFTKPCILDVKIGLCSVGEDATPDKRAAMGAKDAKTTTASLGLRISGFKVYHPATDKTTAQGKPYGQSLNDQGFVDALKFFFGDGGKVRKAVVKQALKFTREVLAWFESQHDARFYSSSILYVYEGAASADDQEKQGNPVVLARMIDFAHVHAIKDGGLDDGYLFGIRKLVKYLEDLAA